MLLKEADDKSTEIEILRGLLESCGSKSTKREIQHEINMLNKGVKGEKTAAYYLDFHFARSKNQILIHDLRLENNGRVAQIDHLLIDRTLEVLVFETKSCDTKIKINEAGEFSRYDKWAKKFVGMASPLKQNDRHIAVLHDVFGEVPMPSRLGIRLEPTFHSVVIVQPDVILDKPKKLKLGNVIKAEEVDACYGSMVDKASSLNVIKSATRIISAATLKEIAEDLIKLHRPITPDYTKKFGLDKVKETVKPYRQQRKETTNSKEAVCGKCNSKNVSIEYGRYGYYFKCADCLQNSSIKLLCSTGHKEKLRKQGEKFFRECSECGTSKLFFSVK